MLWLFCFGVRYGGVTGEQLGPGDGRGRPRWRKSVEKATTTEDEAHCVQ